MTFLGPPFVTKLIWCDVMPLFYTWDSISIHVSATHMGSSHASWRPAHSLFRLSDQQALLRGRNKGIWLGGPLSKIHTFLRGQCKNCKIVDTYRHLVPPPLNWVERTHMSLDILGSRSNWKLESSVWNVIVHCRVYVMMIQTFYHESHPLLHNINIIASDWKALLYKMTWIYRN